MEKYIIIQGINLEEIEQKVNEQIEGGYYPIGGIGITASEQYGVGFFQAMMLPDEDLSFLEDKTRQENGE